MSTEVVSPLRQRMIEDMNARKLGAHSQRGHIHSCKRFAAFVKRSLDTATPDDIRRFQLHLAETGMSICNRNRIMTGVKFLFRVTLRRLDLVAEIYHLREPQKIPLVMSPDETKRLLAVAGATDPPPPSRSPFPLALGRQRTCSHRAKIATSPHRQSCPVTCAPLVHPCTHPHPARKAATRDRFAPTASAPTPPPNPHSARCIGPRGAVATSIRDFVPWRFSDAGCTSV
jgi:hypothetical protein